jgi:glycosyltransferase involved in cell wall biosynthesis
MEAVDSVLEQTFQDFELLVIDDGSTDNTKELMLDAAQKDQRIRYIYQDNAERSAARNHGIELAKGNYICFLDSDDVYLDNHLSSFLETIEKNEPEWKNNPKTSKTQYRNTNPQKQYPTKQNAKGSAKL